MIWIRAESDALGLVIAGFDEGSGRLSYVRQKVPCPTCNGSGSVTANLIHGGETICTDCYGNGEIFADPVPLTSSSGSEGEKK